MRSLLVLCLCLLLALPLTPAHAEQGEVLFKGVATLDLTIRKSASRSASRLGSVQAGEPVEILSMANGWMKVVKGDVEGYILADHIQALEALTSDNPVPEAYSDQTFQPLYTGEATVNLVLRKQPSKESKQLGTIYEEQALVLGEIGPEWTQVMVDKKIGYVLSQYLTGLKAIDPNKAMLPGVTRYPYLAQVVAETDLVEEQTGEVLQQVPVGALLCVEPAQDGQVRLPYKRTFALARAADLTLTQVVPFEEAQPGDLIGVFSTYFPQKTQREVDMGRLHNIQHGVDFVTEALVAPGERFSFNALAAPYSKSNGYQVGPIINYVSDKKTGYGGGVCQVSTTVYNLFLQLPMRIVTTRPHSAYGIDYAPVGFDAAVGSANLDLIAENALPYPVRMTLSVSPGVVTALMYRQGGEL